MVVLVTSTVDTLNVLSSEFLHAGLFHRRVVNRRVIGLVGCALDDVVDVNGESCKQAESAWLTSRY